MRRGLGSFCALLWLAGCWLGCGGDPATGPGPVAWDRDACERCRMLISDPAFAAQVRGAGGRLHRFDDPGCAALWLFEHADAGPAAEVWVGSVDGDGWLDARRARFVRVPRSPMGYGFGASAAPEQAGRDGIDLEALGEAVRARENERRSAAG